MSEGWEVRGPIRREPEPQVIVGPADADDAEYGTPAYELDLEESKDAEELHSIYRDLEFVIFIADYLAKVIERREQQEGPVSVGTAGYLERALYMSVLITYVRCFTTGKRQRLDESIFSGDAEHLLYRHRFYKSTRDKHIAHSVNTFEITKTAAWINGLDTEDPEIRQVGALYVTRTGDALDDVRWLVKLATYVQTVVYGRMDRANQKMDERVRNLPKEELKKLKRLHVQPEHGPDAAAAAR